MEIPPPRSREGSCNKAISAMGIRALIVCIILCRPVGTKSKRGKAPYQTGISIGEKRERYRV
jgi:hypothetical protein